MIKKNVFSIETKNTMMSYCEIAIKISVKSGHPAHKHGALLVKGRQIIATGYNDENHHAEANAILRCLQ